MLRYFLQLLLNIYFLKHLFLIFLKKLLLLVLQCMHLHHQLQIL